MIQIVLIALGALMFIGAFNGLRSEGVWLTSNRRIEGTPAKVIGIGALICGVLVIAYALLILPLD
jgi:hypothetical protein